MSASRPARAAEPARLVTVLTDFGLDDPFVAIMKGVMLREAPGLALVDVSHAVAPQDVQAAAFTLVHSFQWFPVGSVHLCVVDPGVGGGRAAIACEAQGHLFVGPDNGSFTAILDGDPRARVCRIEPSLLGLSLTSRTFHGRDVFAPVAAWLASGRRRLDELGPPHAALRRPPPTPSRSSAGLAGQVVVVDHFGNLITNLPGSWLGSGFTQVEVGEHLLRVVGTYSEAEPGECVALVSSFDTLEVAQRDGNAALALGLGLGEVVRVRARGLA